MLGRGAWGVGRGVGLPKHAIGDWLQRGGWLQRTAVWGELKRAGDGTPSLNLTSAFGAFVHLPDGQPPAQVHSAPPPIFRGHLPASSFQLPASSFHLLC